MSLGVLAGVAALGGLGAVLRVVLAAAVDRRTASPYPWGILAVNLSGAFALGVLAGARLGGDARTLVATGLLGAFTTFSTWIVDSLRLGERAGAANIAGSLVLGLLAVWLGREVGGVL